MEAQQTADASIIQNETTLFGKTTAYRLSDDTLVGEKTAKAAFHVSWFGPAQSKNEIAKAVGPNGSQQFGYRLVNRAIRAGLLTHPQPEHEAANPHGDGAICLTDMGEAFVEELND